MLIAMRKIEKANSCGRKGIPVIKLSLQGEIIKELASVTDATSALGIDRGDIYRVCKGDRKAPVSFG
ncbi:hypothetical protein SAMN05421754_10395 [Nitrosomonas sp. Nm58]|nr:hypothetical protein SAMN05421754_10395 [Nitrosomonas sp. Nm58]